MTRFPVVTLVAVVFHSASGWVTMAPNTPPPPRTSTELNMGLFDGVKDAFAAPALERSILDAERETPIDRWFGWSAKSEDADGQIAQQTPADFVDAMDEGNYIAVELEKPMGIIFEENEEEFGGIFVQSLKEDSAAQGLLQQGDQLVGVGPTKVASLAFEDALGAIVDDEAPKTKLLLFRGTAKQLYGPTGASQEWLDEFITKGGVKAMSS